MFFLAGCVSSAWAQTPPPKPISDIKIKGNSAVSTATIMNKLKMNPGDIFEESALNKELKRLYATGYFADVFVETQENIEGIVVTFTVVEKPLISEIRFQGNSRMKDGRLLRKVTIKKGDLVDFNILSQNAAEIRAYYTEQGYSRATVDYKIETDPATGAATVIFLIDEGQPLKITRINIEGNKSVPAGEIKNYMSTKTAWWFIHKGALDDEKLQADLDRIRNFYRSKGFLDVRVTSKIDYQEDGKTIHLTVIIDEGSQYRIGTITVQGELSFPESEIRKIIKAKTDDPFDYQKIKEDVDNIRSFYYDRGYMNADIDLAHQYNATTDKMDLIYTINGHEVVYVGKVNVIGNTKTKDKVVRRELRVYPGAKYDGERLKYSKERIYNLGFFEDVYFETVPTDEENVKDLNVTVKETKTGELSFGGGFSSVDAFIGFAQVKQRNFDILNFPTFTGGGQDLTLRAEMGSARTNYLLSWTDPWIFDYPYLFGFDVYRREHDKDSNSGYDFDETRTGGSLRLGKELTDQLSTGLIYNLEEVKLDNIADDASQSLKDEQGTNLLSRLTWNIEYDTRDNKYSPTKGLVVGSSLGDAGGFLGGDKDFVKWYLHSSFYHTIIWEVVLNVKGRFGVVQNYGKSDKVPIYEMFFAGGARTIRGYQERAVGPRDPVDNALSVGGEGMAIGNVEVVFPIYKKLVKGSVFYDVGNVTAEAWDIFSDTDYKQGAGVGVRIKTPIGPVQLDWGYPLNENHDDKREGRFYFSVSHGF